MNNKNYIVRGDNTYKGIITSKSNISSAWKTIIKREISSKSKSSSIMSFSIDHSKHRRVITKNTSCLPQIAIKRKDNDSPSSTNTEVVLLNGNWDTSNKIPNIVAEMHNVNIEELQSLQNTCNSARQMETVRKHQDSVATYVSSSPPGSDSGIEGDCNDGNLSWLLNYKIHELPPVPDSGTSTEQQHNGCLANSFSAQPSSDNKVSEIFIAETIPRQYFEQQLAHNVNIGRMVTENKDNGQNREDNGKAHTYRYSGPKKPPFTYTELIEHALCEKGELTVSGIYQWISDHFPFYKQNDDRWKNSVRHNLSINPHFRKGSKAVHGAGHLWTIAQKEDKKAWNIKKQRMQQFMQTTYNNWNGDKQLEMEVVSATASIIPETNGDEYQVENACTSDKNISVHHLNGVKKQNIEVEYVNVIDMSNGLGDFLCPPVSKEQVVEECGLGGDYLITDLNPNSLGLNLAEAEIITGGNLYDDLNFQCYELQTE